MNKIESLSKVVRFFLSLVMGLILGLGGYFLFARDLQGVDPRKEDLAWTGFVLIFVVTHFARFNPWKHGSGFWIISAAILTKFSWILIPVQARPAAILFALLLFCAWRILARRNDETNKQVKEGTAAAALGMFLGLSPAIALSFFSMLRVSEVWWFDVLPGAVVMVFMIIFSSIMNGETGFLRFLREEVIIRERHRQLRREAEIRRRRIRAKEAPLSEVLQELEPIREIRLTDRRQAEWRRLLLGEEARLSGRIGEGHLRIPPAVIRDPWIEAEDGFSECRRRPIADRR